MDKLDFVIPLFAPYAILSKAQNLWGAFKFKARTKKEIPSEDFRIQKMPMSNQMKLCFNDVETVETIEKKIRATDVTK